MPFRRIAVVLALSALGVTFALSHASANDLQEVQQLIRQGQLNPALERVNAYLAQRPKDAQGRFLKGVILTEQNKPAEAIKIFTALTEDYPELPEPYNNLAVLYAAQQQYDKARQALEMAIQTHPSYATAHENLGDIYAKMASQAYDRALQLDRNNAAAQTKLALIKESFPLNARQPRTRPATGAAPAPTFATKPAAPTVMAAAPEPATAAPVGPAPAAKPAEKPAEKPLEKADTNADPTAAILSTVHAWAKAWSDQNVDAYLGFYAPDFQTPKGEPRAVWEKTRRKRVSAPSRIQVTISAPKVTLKGEGRASVTFRQYYKADTLNNATTKTLELVKSKDKWLIRQERIGA